MNPNRIRWQMLLVSLMAAANLFAADSNAASTRHNFAIGPNDFVVQYLHGTWRHDLRFLDRGRPALQARTSSYDYDAPISEAGWTTDKFFKTRDLFAKHLLPGESIPEPPAENPVITIPPMQVQEYAPLFSNQPTPVADEQPRNFKHYNQPFGCIL